MVIAVECCSYVIVMHEAVPSHELDVMNNLSQPTNYTTKPIVYCLGCGSDITEQTADRRSLQSAISACVASSMRVLLELLADKDGSDLRLRSFWVDLRLVDRREQSSFLT